MNSLSLEQHRIYMQQAIEEARKAEAKGEVPIGAVIVKEGQVIGRGHNLRETKHDPLGHAEILAIAQASRYLTAWRLLDCRLYVTLEPCPMCCGAILQARIPEVVFGTHDPKAGCAGSLMNLLHESRFNHQTSVIANVLQTECSELLTSFFRKLRRAAD